MKLQRESFPKAKLLRSKELGLKTQVDYQSPVNHDRESFMKNIGRSFEINTGLH